ncbi:MAG: hypothetical protein B7Z58_02960 [Acidiphilium sp. 37-64-53]|uniref:ImmA/IrrE family metallo-endopeptidase n=1 Tax=Acidiphilium TaxID=522 RepID=UPI000BDD1624|nr:MULTISPECIES: ImmA/IrrE family metallo-endopeptidase [Acidiphilium]OYW03665.1 MAG: hypothetical protein B7Z58_02960 [Acidiphilium sp. 37-64-53]OZB29760.1 MAG: hypothetical protein B7X49_05995 [Acidiphilium sp. 34-64-41]HQT84234.1 ImmA/IrrE family metallo-endopeptidase [Acidiphilium rubrum]
MNLKLEFDVVGTTDIRLAVLVDGEVLWPYPQSSDDGSAIFDAEDVLSYLADAWASLLLSEVWPDIFEPRQEPRSITGLLRAAEDRWDLIADSDGVDIAAEQAEIEGFLYKHDLRSLKGGGALPEFYVMREGSRYRFETGGDVFTGCSYTSFVDQLERLGAFARERLVAAGGAYQRTVARWDSRNQADPILITSYLTALSVADLERERDDLEPLLSSLQTRSLREVANDNAAPLVAVARSSGGLGPRGIADMIAAFRRLPAGPTERLSERRRIVRADLRHMPNSTDQGIRAATSIRDWLVCSPDAAFDLESLSELLSIRVVYVEDLDRRIDGLASAGPVNGPAILLNRGTRRRGSNDDDLDRAIRFTWAHELGHLLLDHDEWPALIDSAQQRVPRRIETRANAFAAYLLLPTTVAYDAFEQHRPRMSWTDIEPVLNEIGVKFAVTRIVASRQVVRGAPPERRTNLDTIFRQNIENF